MKRPAPKDQRKLLNVYIHESARPLVRELMQQSRRTGRSLSWLLWRLVEKGLAR